LLTYGGRASAGAAIGEMQWLAVRALGLSVRERSRGGEAAQHMRLPGSGQGRDDTNWPSSAVGHDHP
jgi:hypothetical protein